METQKIMDNVVKEVLTEEKAKGKVKSNRKKKAEGKAAVKAQGIEDFASEYVKAKVTGLTTQGKAARRIKGIIGALQTRQWTADKKDSMTFTKTLGKDKFTVQIDKAGDTATLSTKGKVVEFPLGKGAFKSIDYVLNAYGHRYVSASKTYEEGVSVV